MYFSSTSTHFLYFEVHFLTTQYHTIPRILMITPPPSTTRRRSSLFFVLNLHSTYTQPTHNLHSTYTQSTHNLHTTYTQPTHNLHSIYTQLTLSLHAIYTNRMAQVAQRTLISIPKAQIENWEQIGKIKQKKRCTGTRFPERLALLAPQENFSTKLLRHST